MKKESMPVEPLVMWEREFRKAANADNLELFRDHLKRHDLPDKPKLLLKGTILVVQALCAYYDMDGHDISEILTMQKYDPFGVPDIKYSYTFDICRKSYGRILVSNKINPWLDLTDLYDFPWSQYKMCGYFGFLVSRADKNPLTPREIRKITKSVTDDFRFDYTENEMDFSFDDSRIEDVLCVDVWDVEEE